MDGLPQHQCIIYEGVPSRHLDSIAMTIIEKLRQNMRCLYLNSPAMVAGMRSVLAAKGLNLADAAGKGALILTSDQSHLVDGKFDPDLMLDRLLDALQEALDDGYKGLWATGDMTWEFGSEKNLSKLVEYETRLENIMENNPALCGVCQYHRDTLTLPAIQTALRKHKAIYVNETMSHLNRHYRDTLAPENYGHDMTQPEIDAMLKEFSPPEET